jgi:hypothetical protein
MEERIDAKRWMPSLADAAPRLLPEGMMLLTPNPCQAVMDGLVRRIFILGFLCRDKRVVTHVEEHCEEIAADAQLRWAIERFENHLKAAELV